MRTRLLPCVIFLLAAMACNFGQVATPEPLSPSVSASATPAVQAGITISATPIKLMIPPSLATGASADTIDVVTDQTGAPWDVAPAHLQRTLQGYSVGTSSHVPQLFVYPADQYAAMNAAAAESIKRLQAVLANPSGSYDENTLPRVPFYNAGQVLAAQQKVLHFSGGSGVRFITQYAQDISPINNGGLFYDFEGLSKDGKYYIVAVLPVNLPFLPVDNNPSSPLPSSGVPFPPSSASGSAFQEYYQQVAQKIEAAPAAQFDPALDALDALIDSMTIGG